MAEENRRGIYGRFSFESDHTSDRFSTGYGSLPLYLQRKKERQTLYRLPHGRKLSQARSMQRGKKDAG